MCISMETGLLRQLEAENQKFQFLKKSNKLQEKTQNKFFLK